MNSTRIPIIVVLTAATLIMATIDGLAQGCEKDTDCKGERICIQGVCQEPRVRISSVCGMSNPSTRNYIPGVASSDAKDLLREVAEAALLEPQDIPEVKNYYLEVYGEYELSESVRVIVGTEDVNCLSVDSIAEKIRAYIRVKPEVVVESAANVTARTTQEGKRKGTTFFDYRKN